MTRSLVEDMQEPSEQRSDYFGDLLGRADERLHCAPIRSGASQGALAFSGNGQWEEGE
jgi:hypothetical protein